MPRLTSETDHQPARRRWRHALLAGMVGCCLAMPGVASAAAPQAMSPDLAKLLPADLKGSLQSQLPASLQSKDVLTMATDGTAGKPIAWIDDSSKIEGVAVDMAEAVSYLFGKKVVILNTPFDDLIPSLQSGRADFSMSDMLDTKKREAIVDFVDYLVDGSSILVASDSKLSGLTLDKMCGLTVGSIRGSVEEGYLDKQTAACKTEGKKPITINVYQGNDAMLLALVSGRIDALMGASAQLSYIQEISHGKAKQGGDPVGVAVDGIAMPKNSGLAAPMQAALQKLMDSGIYTKILGLYGMQSNGVPKATLNHASY